LPVLTIFKNLVPYAGERKTLAEPLLMQFYRKKNNSGGGFRGGQRLSKTKRKRNETWLRTNPIRKRKEKINKGGNNEKDNFCVDFCDAFDFLSGGGREDRHGERESSGQSGSIKLH
jgi:hypothetical protein